MSFEKDKLPLIFDKILQEIEKNGGSITTDEFKLILYKTRLTEDEIINELYGIEIDREKIKSFLKLRLTKSDTKDIKTWLMTNGYISIDHLLHKEIITIENNRSFNKS